MSPFAVDYANLPIVEPTSSPQYAAPTGSKSSSGPSFLDHFQQADRSSRTAADRAAQADRRDDEPSSVGDSRSASGRDQGATRSEQPAESKRVRHEEKRTDASAQDGSRVAAQDDSSGDEEPSDDSETATAVAIAGVQQEPVRDPAQAAEEIADEAKLEKTQALKSVLPKTKRRGGKAEGAADGKATPDATEASSEKNKNTTAAAETTAVPIVAESEAGKPVVEATASSLEIVADGKAVSPDDVQATTVTVGAVDGAKVENVVVDDELAKSSTVDDALQAVVEAAKQAQPTIGAEAESQSIAATETTAAANEVVVETIATPEAAVAEATTTEDRKYTNSAESHDRRGEDIADPTLAVDGQVVAPPTFDSTLAAAVIAPPTATLSAENPNKAATNPERGSDGNITTIDARRDPPPPDAPRAHARFDTIGTLRSSTSTESGSSLSQADRVRLIQRVARAVQTAQERGGELKLRLSPPELGSLRLEVQFKDGTLSARIETQTPEAKQVIVESLPALRERLSEQNIRVERFDVDLSNSGSHGGSPQSFDGGSDSSPRGAPRSANGPRRETESPRADRGVEGVRAPTVDGRLNILI